MQVAAGQLEAEQACLSTGGQHISSLVFEPLQSQRPIPPEHSSPGTVRMTGPRTPVRVLNGRVMSQSNGVSFSGSYSWCTTNETTVPST